LAQVRGLVVIMTTGPMMRKAVATGDRRAGLEALRDFLAAQLAGKQASVALAPLANQLREVMAELDSMPDERAEVSRVADLQARLDRKRSAAG
jgi:hypothetical protein